MTETVTYGDIRDGDIVFVQGFRFTVRDVKRYPASEASDARRDGTHTDVIRFSGYADADSPLHGTGYSGPAARYGGYADVPVMRETEGK